MCSQPAGGTGWGKPLSGFRGRAGKAPGDLFLYAFDLVGPTARTCAETHGAPNTAVK
jgi:hypothetical protein